MALPAAPASVAPPPADLPEEVERAMALALAAGRGNLRATCRLLELLAPRIARVVAVVLGRAHPDVDDAIQQALLAVAQALPAFRGECHPAGYATRIAVRTAWAVRRRARLAAAQVEAIARTEVAPEPAPSPGEESIAARRRAVLRELLDELPPEQAETLALRVMLGWTLEEVAEATGAPVNTVRSRVRLAKEALRRRIESDPTLADELEA